MNKNVKEEIVIDENVYILKTKHEKLLDEAKAASKSDFGILDIHMDPSNVFGLGTAQLTGEWVSSRISLDLLKRALTILEKLGNNSVDIVFTKDHPVIFGTLEANKQKVSGVIMAPRVDEK